MSKGGSTTSTQAIDPQLKAAYLENLGQAKSVATALPVRQFADFNPMYQYGEEQLINTGLAGPGIYSADEAAFRTGIEGRYQPEQIGVTDVNAAQANLGMGGGPGTIGSYMNPYTQYVRENALSDLETSRQNAIRQTSQQAQKARAFGGSRQGVAEAQTNIGYGTEAGKLSTQLNENAFNQAMAAQQQDLARRQQASMQNAAARNAMEQFNANTGLAGAQFRLGAANQLGNLGSLQQGLRMTGAQAAMGAGSARQQLEQQQLDALRNIGVEKLGVSTGALGGNIPNLGMSTTTPYSKNVASGALGGALAGGRMFGPVGAGIGGLLGLFA